MNDDTPAMTQHLPLLTKTVLILLMIGFGLAYLTPFTLMALGSLRGIHRLYSRSALYGL